jgi:hypothetical protein
VPLTNRVLPTGEIVALAERGTFMGNRGILHDADKRITRPYRLKAWLICQTSFNGRRRVLMGPNTYTELFFLDEPTALAAGHRPCFECRRTAANAFAAAWARAHGSARAADIDARLHTDRWDGRRQRRYTAPAQSLPENAMVLVDDAAWLVTADGIRRWTPAGYTDHAPRPLGDVTVLTPAATVAALAAGYLADRAGGPGFA